MWASAISWGKALNGKTKTAVRDTNWRSVMQQIINDIANVGQSSDGHLAPIAWVFALESFLCLTLGLDNFE